MKTCGGTQGGGDGGGGWWWLTFWRGGGLVIACSRFVQSLQTTETTERNEEPVSVFYESVIQLYR